MKQIKMAAILVALVLGGLTSCTKDNSGTATASTTSIINGKGGGGTPVGNTRAILESGTWTITGFSNGQNSISFAGYAFNFSDDGTANVTYGGTMYTGSWATTAELQDLVHLDYGEATAALMALNGDWQVVNINASSVQVQGANGKGSFTFQKM
jgi:hypothetical protein